MIKSNGPLSSQSRSIGAVQALSGLVLAATGDSLTWGGNGGQTLAAGAFVGAGTTGTITVASDVMPGSSIFIASLNQSEWLGRKTVLTNTGAVVTFTNDTALTAAPTVNAAFATASVNFDTYITNRNFLNLANGLLGFPFTSIKNRAITGAKSDYVLSRFATDVLSISPTHVWILCGVNDITADVAEATIFANIQSMCISALANGIIVLLATLPPLTTAGGTGTGGSATVARQQTLLRLNKLIRDYANITPGVILIDCHRRVSSVTTRDWITGGSLFSIDGTHWTSHGAYNGPALELQSVLSSKLNQPFPLVDNDLDAYEADNSNLQLMPDPMFQNSTVSAVTGFTGSYQFDMVPQQLVGAPTATISLVARADGRGNNQRTVITATVANDIIEYRFTNTGTLNTRLNLYTGRTARFAMAFKQSSVPSATVSGIDCFLEMTSGGVVYRQFITAANTVPWPNNDAELMLISEPFIIPPVVTLSRLFIRYRFQGIANGATFEYGRWELKVL